MIQIITPQFERTDGKTVPAPSIDMPLSEWQKLPTFSHELLLKLGLGVWDKTETSTHYLFPKEWYPIIPKGLMVTMISGETVPFEPGVTDDDTRFGCLAYGFIKPAKPEGQQDV